MELINVDKKFVIFNRRKLVKMLRGVFYKYSIISSIETLVVCSNRFFTADLNHYFNFMNAEFTHTTTLARLKNQ
jgi:hypothetical protein